MAAPQGIYGGRNSISLRILNLRAYTSAILAVAQSGPSSSRSASVQTREHLAVVTFVSCSVANINFIKLCGQNGNKAIILKYK